MAVGFEGSAGKLETEDAIKESDEANKDAFEPTTETSTSNKHTETKQEVQYGTGN